MKQWLKWTLLVVLVLAASASGIFAWLTLTKDKPASFNHLVAVRAIDQEARAKYQEAQKIAAEKIAKEAAAKAAKEAAEKAAKENAAKTINANTTAKKGGAKRVTYSVAKKGNPSASLSEFRVLAAETFNDARGWVRAGVYFQEVSSGGDFTLWLSEASLVPSFSPSICSKTYSCSIGRNVIINDTRWRNASDAWNAAGGSLRNYRHMVVNHEVGHFLGHRDNQPVCGGPGQLAPLMQQQSISLRGCTFNPWPLNVELWTNR
ncbi:MAG: DUF3152 domain-containing protein [Candidatus Nomurabacteria bacterium]|jgi:hypothetical protein|nr:DUF3152 domain-containing protein [Candidatus Nomurabacteria bacterium]